MSFRESKKNWLGSPFGQLCLSELEARGLWQLAWPLGDFVASSGRWQGRSGNRPAESVYFIQ